MNNNETYCGGELITAVDDVACERCGQMAYPCPCEAEPMFRIECTKYIGAPSFTLSREYATRDEAEAAVRVYSNLFPYYYTVFQA